MTFLDDYVNLDNSSQAYYFKAFLESIVIIDIGYVSCTYDNGCVSVTTYKLRDSEPIVYTNLEVLTPFGYIQGNLSECTGLVVFPRSVLSSAYNSTVSVTSESYSLVGAKFIPLCMGTNFDTRISGGSDGISIGSGSISLSFNKNSISLFMSRNSSLTFYDSGLVDFILKGASVRLYSEPSGHSILAQFNDDFKIIKAEEWFENGKKSVYVGEYDSDIVEFDDEQGVILKDISDPKNWKVVTEYNIDGTIVRTSEDDNKTSSITLNADPSKFEVSINETVVSIDKDGKVTLTTKDTLDIKLRGDLTIDGGTDKNIVFKCKQFSVNNTDLEVT